VSDKRTTQAIQRSLSTSAKATMIDETEASRCRPATARVAIAPLQSRR
jgi:hypothetical protein